MSTVTTTKSAPIATLQAVEQHAAETGQDFFAVLLEHCEVLTKATATDVYQSSRRLHVRPSTILAIYERKRHER